MAGLKILILTRDASIGVENSPAYLRMKRYGELVEELQVIVLSDNSHLQKDIEISANTHVHFVPTGGLFPSAAAARLGKKLIFDRSYVRGRSVIVAEDRFECAQAGLQIKKRWKLPLEVHVDTDLTKLGFWQAQSIGSVLKRADTVIVANGGMAADLAKTFRLAADRIRVAPPYIDRAEIEASPVRFDLHARYPWKFIMLAAAIHGAQGKNFSMAIEVLAKLRKYFPETGLLILGASMEERVLKAQAHLQGVEESVAFAEAGSDWASYYKTANLFIQTSEFESYGEELITAGLSGLPVVSTPVGIAAELENGRDALICPPGDAEFMFKAIYDLMHNDGLRELLRAHVRTALTEKLVSATDDAQKTLASWESTAAMVSSLA